MKVATWVRAAGRLLARSRRDATEAASPRWTVIGNGVAVRAMTPEELERWNRELFGRRPEDPWLLPAREKLRRGLL